MKNLFLIPMILNLFDGINKTTDTTATTGNDLSAENKTFYDKALIYFAEPYLVHDQFGQKKPIPARGGKTIEFRRYDSLPKATTPLAEGITPTGQKMNVVPLTSTVSQYGGFIEYSDVLQLTAIDDNMKEAVKLIASQAGRTLDTVTREVLNGGSNVQFGAGAKTARIALVGGDATAANNDYLTVAAVKRAVRALKVQNTPKINGYYVGIIHPDCSFDLTNDPEWRQPHQYKDTLELYNGEIGAIAGVRFVETTEAKVFHADDLASNARNLKINNADGYSGAITSVAFDGGTVADSSLVGRLIAINGVTAKITANTTTALTFASTNFGSIADNADIYPGEAGAAGRDVYSTLIFGENAYGVTEVTGGGLTTIVKQLGSAGTADPLNQRATVGWKAIKTAEILIQQYICRIETASTFNDIGAN